MTQHFENYDGKEGNIFKKSYHHLLYYYNILHNHNKLG
jgi:hypothetical protein